MWAPPLQYFTALAVSVEKSLPPEQQQTLSSGFATPSPFVVTLPSCPCDHTAAWSSSHHQHQSVSLVVGYFVLLHTHFTPWDLGPQHIRPSFERAADMRAPPVWFALSLLSAQQRPISLTHSSSLRLARSRVGDRPTNLSLLTRATLVDYCFRLSSASLATTFG
jgi:hypothetical protein